MNNKLKLVYRDFVNKVRVSKEDVLENVRRNFELRFKVEELDKVTEFLKTSDSNINLLKSSIQNGYVVMDGLQHLPFIPLNYFDMLEDGVVTFVPENYLKNADNSFIYDFMEKWEYSNTLSRVVITHKDCQDGYGSAAAVTYHRDTILKGNNITDEIEILYVNYKEYDINELLKTCEGKLVLVGDFSFNLEELTKLEEVANDVLIIDHHESAFNSPIADKLNVHLDMTSSGADLVYRMLFQCFDKAVPLVISLISDRDLFNFFYGDYSKALTLMIKAEGAGIITEFMEKPEDMMEALMDYLPVVTEMERKYISKANDAEKYTINGITFHGLNLTDSVSDILNHVSRIFETPSFSYSIKDSVLSLAFRNYKDDIDVSKIAERFNGGGHKQASGGKVSCKEIDLYDFFVNHNLGVKPTAKQFIDNLKSKLDQ